MPDHKELLAYRALFDASLSALEEGEGELNPDAEHPIIYETLETVIDRDSGLGLRTEHAFALLAVALHRAKPAREQLEASRQWLQTSSPGDFYDQA
jgi:hypothetical protein